MADTALILKQKFDSGQISDFREASGLLESSLLMKKLLSDDFNTDVLNLLNRLTELSEIPFAGYLPQVQVWCKKLVELSFCGDGFSLSGKSDYILSCYNSMIISILIRLNYQDKEPILRGINWILQYQNVARNTKSQWIGTGILKYGGCMKSTPCYIGIVKAMIALSDYKRQKGYEINGLLEDKLSTGLEYILKHQIFRRLSNGSPITKDIMKITYPFSYKTNIIEILRLLKDNGLDSDERCTSAKDFIISKKKKDEYWQVNNSYLPKAWVQFDHLKEPGLWVTHEILKLLP
jgi:hypothetical protein